MTDEYMQQVGKFHPNLSTKDNMASHETGVNGKWIDGNRNTSTVDYFMAEA